MTEAELKTKPGYVDPAYLAKAAQILSEKKKKSYDALALSAGQKVLDVGCGPATDTIDLAKIVGSSGIVVGVDHDPEMVRLADLKAKEAGISWCSHVLADAVKSIPFPDQHFDAVRVERVLQHVTDPAAALKEIVRVLKPGGIVSTLDPDWDSGCKRPLHRIGIYCNFLF